MKKIFIISITIIAVFAISGCTTDIKDNTTADTSYDTESYSSVESFSDNDTQPSLTDSEEDLRVFTLTELAEYDGKEGRKAYVAVDGLVYDLTEVSAWSGGSHFRNITAGKDLTDVLLDDSPHGARVLENLTIVGELEK